MTLSTHLFLLPEMSQYSCTQGIIHTIHKLNKNPTLENKISAVALVALAELAALFDLGVEILAFTVHLIEDAWNFKFEPIEKIQRLFFSFLELNLFFLGLVPFLIESGFDLSQLDNCIEKTLCQNTKSEAELQKKEVYLSMTINYKAVLTSNLMKYDQLMDPHLTYLQKFELTENQADEIPKNIEYLLFITTVKNHPFLQIEGLSESDLRKCENIQKIYRMLLSLFKSYQKVYDFEVFQKLYGILNEDIQNIAVIANYAAYGDSIHSKIYWTFQKLYTIYSFGLIAERKESKSKKDLDQIEITKHLLNHVYRLFDDYLNINHPDLELHSKRMITIRDEQIKLHFNSSQKSELTLGELNNMLESLFEQKKRPKANLANQCMALSLFRYSSLLKSGQASN